MKRGWCSIIQIKLSFESAERCQNISFDFEICKVQFCWGYWGRAKKWTNICDFGSIVRFKPFWQVFNYIHSTVIHAQIISKWALEHGLLDFQIRNDDSWTSISIHFSHSVRSMSISLCQTQFESIATAVNSNSTTIRLLQLREECASSFGFHVWEWLQSNCMQYLLKLGRCSS